MATLISHQLGRRAVTSAELFERLQRGSDPRARERLIERFLPLARKLAARYARSNEPFEDLVQVASVGLVKAVDRFEPARGYAFTSFAVPTILGELKRHFRDHGWAIHVERGARERAQAVAEAELAIRELNGRAPSVREIAQYAELSTEDVIEGLQVTVARDLVSLDAPISLGGENSPISRSDAIGEIDAKLGLADERVSVRAAAARLPKLERQVLYLRFGVDLSQSEIAERLGVSQMQVSRLLRRSLGRMQEQLAGERRA